MSSKNTHLLTPIVVFVLITAAFGLFAYRRTLVEAEPGDFHVKTGNYRLEDGRYEEAIAEFELALEQNAAHRGAHFGLALTYIQTLRLDEALAKLDETLAIDPEFAVAYANRGITHDRLERYEAAVADYRRAVELDPEVAEGPGRIWRFLHNVPEKPPTIAERADYLEAELAKPPQERLLRVPEEDEKQRMYKVD